MTNDTADAITHALAPAPDGAGRAEVRRRIRAARRLTRQAAAARDPETRAALRREAGTEFVRAVVLERDPNGRPRPPKVPPGPPQPLNLPLGLVDTANAGARLTDARLTATQWRYEHLRALAARAAQDALEYEGQVLTLMQMALAKESAAQTVLAPALLQAIEQVKGATSEVRGLGHDAGVEDALKRAADLVGRHLVLTMAIEWFITHDVVEFWIGLFGAVISDVSHFDAGLSRTGRYLDAQFGLLGLKGELDRLTDQLDERLDLIMRPLEDAVNGLVADTGGAMRELFSGFDLPLTAAVADGEGLPPALDVNPLAGVEETLRAAVAEVRDQLKAALLEALDATGLAATFREVMLWVVVVPILAVLAVGLATGPVGGALIAAVVLIGAQELVHLVLSWLSGPVLDAADGLRRDAMKALDAVKARVAGVLDTVNAANPAAEIDAVASQLRAITALLPEAFLDDAAALLDAARDVAVGTAVDLALAAEQALGMENATAFDAIGLDYPSEVTAAPLMPGGRDEHRFSAQALLRDLGRLDRQRTTMRDSREFEVVHRVSLAALLGTATGGGLNFLTQRTALVPLDADALLAPSYGHGIYRAIIKEIRPSVVLAAADAVTAPLALTVTHTGASRTRVNVTANPAAPPVELPRALLAAGEAATTTRLRAAVADGFYAGIQRVATQATDLPGSRPPWFLEGLPFSEFIDGRQREMSPGDAWAVMKASAAEAVAQVLAEDTGGAVAAAPVVAALEQLVAPLDPWSHAVRTLTVEEDGTLPIAGNKIDPEARTAGGESVWQSAAAARAYLAMFSGRPGPVARSAGILAAFAETAIRFVNEGNFGVAVAAAYEDARDAAERHIGKWAGARYEDDPVPAAGALGYVTLVRDDAPETVGFSLVAPPGGTRAIAAPAASSPAGPPVGGADALRYGPFENRGFTGTLRVSLPGVVPFAVGAVQDVLLDVVVRACYDPDLADAVAAQRSLVPALTPVPTPAAPEVHRILVSLRALSGVESGPLRGVPSVLPLALGGDGTLPLGGSGSLHIPLDALRLAPALPVPALDAIEVLAAGAAVIPAATSPAGGSATIVAAPQLRAALGAHGDGALAMTTRRPAAGSGDGGQGPAPAEPEPPLPRVLASTLASGGVATLFTVNGLGDRPVHDVLVSLTYRIVGGAPAGGPSGGSAPAGLLAIGGFSPASGSASTAIRVDAATGANFTAVRTAELVPVALTLAPRPCVIRERHAGHVTIVPGTGTPPGEYRIRLNGDTGVVPALSPTTYQLML